MFNIIFFFSKNYFFMNFLVSRKMKHKPLFAITCRLHINKAGVLPFSKWYRFCIKSVFFCFIIIIGFASPSENTAYHGKVPIYESYIKIWSDLSNFRTKYLEYKKSDMCQISFRLVEKCGFWGYKILILTLCCQNNRY